jgi:hypothetical protein
VFGRYVLNSSPRGRELRTGAVLYVTLIGAAVGVRDAGTWDGIAAGAGSDSVRNRIEL